MVQGLVRLGGQLFKVISLRKTINIRLWKNSQGLHEVEGSEVSCLRIPTVWGMHACVCAPEMGVALVRFLYTENDFLTTVGPILPVPRYYLFQSQPYGTTTSVCQQGRDRTKRYTSYPVEDAQGVIPSTDDDAVSFVAREVHHRLQRVVDVRQTAVYGHLQQLQLHGLPRLHSRYQELHMPLYTLPERQYYQDTSRPLPATVVCYPRRLGSERIPVLTPKRFQIDGRTLSQRVAGFRL